MNKETANNTKEYEILYFLSITLDPEQIKTIKQKVNDIITKYDSIIIKEEDLGKKKLAYAIKHARHGHYILTIFKTNPDKLAKINHNIQIMPEVSRHKIVTKEKIKKIKLDKRTADKSILVDKTALPKTTLSKKDESTSAKTTKEESVDKVDIKELDRKIDELLGEQDV